MKETTFIRQNKEKWKSYETECSNLKSIKADRLVMLYRDVLADLCYVQTQYPKSRLVTYLNNMARRLHDHIYTPPKLKMFSAFKQMVAREIPMIIADARYEILVSLCIFLFFVIGGVILACQDLQNVINTLGTNYVNMTLENIRNGVPTDVYNHSEQNAMFAGILLNNIRVDLYMYIAGVMPYVGTAYFLHANGVMLGEFQTIFFQYGVGFESMSAIWIHGTLEISALIISSGASLALGRAWSFRGTYSLRENLKRKGLRSVKILLSTLPLTFTAAIFESYVTRYVNWPLAVRLFFIFGSLAFVVLYYIYLPYVVYKRNMSIDQIEDEYAGE